MESFEDVQRIVMASEGGPLVFVVSRDGKDLSLSATPVAKVTPTAIGPLRRNILGVAAEPTADSVKLKRYGIVDSLDRGASETWTVITGTGH